MARISLKSKRIWKKICSIVLSIGLVLGSVVGLTSLLVKIEEDNLKTILPTYHIGNVSDVDGKYVESSTSIYSDLFECQGLQVTPDFDSKVIYKIFYYDYNEDFIGSSADNLVDFYKIDFPIARYARIKIIPIDDEKVSWYEVAKYSTQLKLEVNKEQNKKFTGIKLSSTLNSEKEYTKNENDIVFSAFDCKNCSVIYGNIRNFDLDTNELTFTFSFEGGAEDVPVIINKSLVSNNGLFEVEVPTGATQCVLTSFESDVLVVTLYF